MPIYTKQDVLNAFNKLKVDDKNNPIKTGFVINMGSEKRANFYYKGNFIFHTAVPGGRGDLRPGTQRAIMRQTNLQRNEFIDFVDCPLGMDGMIKALKDSETI